MSRQKKATTTKQLGWAAARTVAKMSPDEKAKLRARLRREFEPKRELIKTYLLVLLNECTRQDGGVIMLVEPCKRASGTPRAFFETQEQAVAFAADPANTAYHHDVVVFCGRCGKYHLSHPSWLSSRPWETIASQLRSN
jgi:hypothetical protein